MLVQILTYKHSNQTKDEPFIIFMSQLLKMGTSDLQKILNLLQMAFLTTYRAKTLLLPPELFCIHCYPSAPFISVNPNSSPDKPDGFGYNALLGVCILYVEDQVECLSFPPGALRSTDGFCAENIVFVS